MQPVLGYHNRTQYLGRMAGIHAIVVNAFGVLLVTLASSRTPPLLQSGPTGETFHRISSASLTECVFPRVGLKREAVSNSGSTGCGTIYKPRSHSVSLIALATC